MCDTLKIKVSQGVTLKNEQKVAKTPKGKRGLGVTLH